MAGAIVVVFVVEIRAIVRMDVLVDRTVVMSVAVRMIVGVARIGVLVGMHRAVIVLVGTLFSIIPDLPWEPPLYPIFLRGDDGGVLSEPLQLPACHFSSACPVFAIERPNRPRREFNGNDYSGDPP